MKEIVLYNDKIKMGVLPELGGSVSFFKYHQKDKFVDIMRPYEKSAKGDDANNSSLFVMVPFCSRIRGGSFVYWGITRKMQKNHPGIQDPIHGDGWKSAWEVISQTDTKIEMKLIHNKEDGGFPFSYEALLSYELKNDQLKINISVKNLNTLPMPCGFGIHPFFIKTKETELDFTSSIVWSNETDPIFDKPYTTPDTWQFAGGKPIKNAVFDTCFGGFNGNASILYPELGISVAMQTDEIFGHSILYSPRGKNYFCFEPVTNATNAFNLAANGSIGTGMKSIGPNQKISGSISLTVRG
ncbi:MAG: aldose 1-epimerase [Alphaproteobacteria bacterium]|nr:aldose 1-epimerase [Alphaproteobacteria bacterium]